MQGKITSVRASEAVYVGIDVCKAWLDVYVHPTGQTFRFANSKEGIRQLREELDGASVALVVMEATGKLHRLAHRMLSQAGYAVAAVNPSRPRKFAEAKGQLAKTDKIDARLLALFGAQLSPAARPVPAARRWRSFRNWSWPGKPSRPMKPRSRTVTARRKALFSSGFSSASSRLASGRRQTWRRPSWR